MNVFVILGTSKVGTAEFRPSPNNGRATLLHLAVQPVKWKKMTNPVSQLPTGQRSHSREYNIQANITKGMKALGITLGHRKKIFRIDRKFFLSLY
jgi:hypothetical protein